LNDRGIIRKRQLRDRCTVYLDPAINQQLDLVARIERRQRSEVVTDILRHYLPKYQIKRG
jgi:metal-responsive CopG/Arc/MetJ family transcriptional regulator